jgi:hypothetical protein
MKYILIIWYLVTPSSVPSDEVPIEQRAGTQHVSGASIENLNYEQEIKVLGRYDTKLLCDEVAEKVANAWIESLETEPKAIIYGCYQDPKEAQ